MEHENQPVKPARKRAPRAPKAAQSGSDQVQVLFRAETVRVPGGKAISLLFPLDLRDIAEKAIRMVSSRYRLEGRFDDAAAARLSEVV